jgi:hypothetical protein
MGGLTKSRIAPFSAVIYAPTVINARKQALLPPPKKPFFAVKIRPIRGKMQSVLGIQRPVLRAGKIEMDGQQALFGIKHFALGRQWFYGDGIHCNGGMFPVLRQGVQGTFPKMRRTWKPAGVS